VVSERRPPALRRTAARARQPSGDPFADGRAAGRRWHRARTGWPLSAFPT